MTTIPIRTAPAPRRRRRVWPVLGVLAVLIALGWLASLLWTDWLWFRSLGMTNVFSTNLSTSLLLFGVFALVSGAAVGVTIWLAMRLRPKVRPRRDSAVLEQSVRIIEARSRAVIVVPILLAALFGGLYGASLTATFLAWAHRTPFGQRDPYSGLDASFFVFDLPWWNAVVGTALTLAVICTIVASVVHFCLGAIQVVRPRLAAARAGRVSSSAEPTMQQLLHRGAQRHISILIAITLVLWGIREFLGRFAYQTNQGGLFTGIAYTDEHARIGASTVVACLFWACALLFALNVRVLRWTLAGISLVVLLVSVLVVSGIYPVMLQQLVVRPSEQDTERTYIANNIAATRSAFGIDKVRTTEGYTARTDATAGQLRADAEALPAIRLMDPAVVGKTFEHLQQVRGYYSFPNVLDVDRYQVDGRTNDVVIAAREVDVDKIVDPSWNNLHTVYTHGYGLVASYGNRAQPNGEPDWLVSGISNKGGLGTYEPRIYFGEMTDHYVVVGGTEGGQAVEFDQPTGEGQATKNTYAGKGGVSLSNPLTRLAYTIRLGEPNLVLSSRVGPDSKMLVDRQPVTRARQVAPWLTWDQETYPAIVDGRVVWIVDGYTTTANYPNSQRTNMRESATDARSDGARLQQNQQVNYIRNSVKGVVDAYDGTVKLFAWDEADPLLQTWRKVYPNTVAPKSAMSRQLLEHLRYPQDLFKVQREVLTRYHTTDPYAWIQNTDRWAVPNDPVKDKAKSEPPYFLSIKWPGEEQPVYSQTATFVPNNRQNLRAFMAVDSDATSKDYGTLKILQMDDSVQIAGPAQTMNAITTDPVVAEKLRPYLNQGAATAEYGNLMTLPMGGGMLYVLPIFAERQTGAAGYPALQFVAVRFGEKVGIATTLQGALDSVFGGNAGASTDEHGATKPTQPGTPSQPSSGSNPKATELLNQAQAEFQAAQQALQQGDLGKYQEHVAAAKAKVDQAQKELGRK